MLYHLHAERPATRADTLMGYMTPTPTNHPIIFLQIYNLYCPHVWSFRSCDLIFLPRAEWQHCARGPASWHMEQGWCHCWRCLAAKGLDAEKQMCLAAQTGRRNSERCIVWGHIRSCSQGGKGYRAAISLITRLSLQTLSHFSASTIVPGNIGLGNTKAAASF